MSLRFVTSDQVVPTVVGLLAVGKSPADFVPGAHVQFLRIGGIQLSDPIIDQRDCHGPLSEMLREVDDVLSAHNRIATDVTSPT